MDKIAAECCGSCVHFGDIATDFMHRCLAGQKFFKRDEDGFFPNKDEWEGLCDIYSPRNPIDNPYKRYKDMWEELVSDVNNSFVDFKDKPEFRLETNALLLVLDRAKRIDEKHK
jgi:hypothetical protein